MAASAQATKFAQSISCIASASAAAARSSCHVTTAAELEAAVRATFIEKLTEISEFIETVVQKSEELQVGIDSMTEHYECLEGLQFETPQEDFTARWESFHWPLRLKLKQEECNKMLEWSISGLYLKL